MRIVKPSFKIHGDIDGDAILKHFEACGRICYKSECSITPDSARKFVASILASGHESVIEHTSISCTVVCDRGVSHEIVRHRIASYSQESTRYCNYAKDKFGNELTFVEPCFWPGTLETGMPPNSLRDRWFMAMRRAEESYLELLAHGATPQEARSVLPNSLKTEIVMTMNLREWRHFFRLRTSPKAHPQMVEIASAMLAEFRRLVPVIFDTL